MTFDHIWFWRRKPEGQDRKGQRCRVLARGAMNSIAVEFEDGYKLITSRYAVRKATVQSSGRGKAGDSPTERPCCVQAYSRGYEIGKAQREP